ncbi:Ribonuclease H-like domain [Phytophthora cactorum]|nr:Ribonuclease H-like domain [Phytophthora cactorum]
MAALDGHVSFLRDMLSQDYGKTLENCLYLVGDNCATNRRLATLMGVPLVGCASHRLNLANQSLLENFKDELAQVRDLMITLKSLNQSAKLRFKTKLRSVLTRWSSTFCMVNRYVKLLEYIQDDDDLAEYLPSPAANRTLCKLLEDLKKIESVSKELQSKSVSIVDVRSYFDALIEQWPEFATYLGKLVRFYTKREHKFILIVLCAGSRAATVHNPHFEAGCVKVQRGESAELTLSEKAALSRFAVLEAVEQPLTADHETTGSFVEQVKKKRKTLTSAATYMLLQSPPHPTPPPTHTLQTRWSGFSVWPRPPSAFNGSVFNQLHWR